MLNKEFVTFFSDCQSFRLLRTKPSLAKGLFRMFTEVGFYYKIIFFLIRNPPMNCCAQIFHTELYGIPFNSVPIELTELALS